MRDALAQQDGLYDCQRAPQADGIGTPEHRAVTVRIDPASRNAVLILPGERHQVLAPVQGATAGLYANQVYAWRANAKLAVLTDIEKVTTYSCRRVGYAAVTRRSAAG